MQIVSINTADGQLINTGNKDLPTGIFKQPCSGPIAITEQGVAGDTVVDTQVHGGADQAVYLYSLADYQWWSETLGREITPGTFGENLTFSCFPDQPLRVGDRLNINDTIVLEITAPRVPCLKLASRMSDPAFGKKFVAAVRPGAYARVLSSGIANTGDKVQWLPADENYILVNDLFIEWHKKDWSRAVFQRALKSPISCISRRIIEERYCD